MATRVKVSKGQKHDVDINDDELDFLSEIVQPSESKSNRVTEPGALRRLPEPAPTKTFPPNTHPPHRTHALASIYIPCH
jgi:hypothetical protein